MKLTDSLDWIESRQSELLEQLMQLSGMNSGTSNLSGLNKIADEFVSLFSPIADKLEILESDTLEQVDHEGNAGTKNYGKVLSFSKRPDAPVKVLLCGHMDTVFSEEHQFQSPERVSEDSIRGPGVADMKGGILVMLTALQAFEQTADCSKLGWQVLLNSDEETGSHGSAKFLQAAALEADAGMIFEPALADGTLAGARKGSGNFTLVVHGRAAHAGREFSKGRNAIVALTDAIVRLAALTDSDKGVTVNIARVSGGSAFNVVPDKATCQLNVRCHTPEDQQAIAGQMQAIVSELNQQSDSGFELFGKFSRPPKALSSANLLLMDWAKQCGLSLQLDVRFKDTGGCCDGNNLAAAGLPNIDTLGVRGGQIHTDQEFMLIDSLTERARLSLLLLNKLASDGEQLVAAGK